MESEFYRTKDQSLIEVVSQKYHIGVNIRYLEDGRNNHWFTLRNRTWGTSSTDMVKLEFSELPAPIQRKIIQERLGL